MSVTWEGRVLRGFRLAQRPRLMPYHRYDVTTPPTDALREGAIDHWLPIFLNFDIKVFCQSFIEECSNFLFAFKTVPT